MAVIARESAYSGKKVDWKWAMEESGQNLAGETLTGSDGGGDPSFESAAPEMEVPVPGRYKLV